MRLLTSDNSTASYLREGASTAGPKLFPFPDDIEPVR
jgi:hypothetical protein